MLTVRHKSSKSFASPRIMPQSARNLDLETGEQQDRIKKLLNDVRRGGPLSPSAVLLPQREYNRMRNSAIILTKEELLQQKKIHEEQKEKQQAAAKARKQKMLDIESERKQAIPPSDTEIEKRIIDDNIRARAQDLLNEEKDDVKHMNQMMLYAKVVTVRDTQLKEKKELKDYTQKETKRKDLLMEVDRLKKIKYYEEQERLKKEEQKLAAQETIKQIKEREAIRMKLQEQKDREGQEMIRKIVEIQQEESRNNLMKREQQRVLLDLILVENQKAIATKHEKARLEKEEEEKIAKYLIDKAEKEAEYQAELKRVKDEKEREIQKLREMQEKHSDRQAEIDSLRAKRANEHADRQARLKERMEAEKKARINQELMEARRLQSLQKEFKIQEQAQNERNEFQRIVHTQKLERELELKMEQEKRTRVFDHAEQLKKQIAIHEEKHKQARREFLEEGKKMKDKMSNEKALLEDIKGKKLQQLVELEIPGKYTSELARKRIMI